MHIVLTYIAPTARGHSGCFGKQSEAHFDSLEEARRWLQCSIPEHQHDKVKVWGNDLQITGAARDALLLPAEYRSELPPSVWVKPKYDKVEWQVAHYDIVANRYYVKDRSLAYAASELEIGPIIHEAALDG